MSILHKFNYTFLFSCYVFFCSPLCAAELQERQNSLSFRVGWEQLSYKEEVTELSLVSSKTKVNNIVLNLDGQKEFANYVLGVKGTLPLSYGDAKEQWKRAGLFEQSNSLSYRRAKGDIFCGYALHELVNPYVGTNGSYSQQTRDDFQTADNPEIQQVTITEVVTSLSFLFGVRGKLLINSKWSLGYFIEYLVPYYSRIKNDALDGWQVSDIDGYAFSLAGQLEYRFSNSTALTLQVMGGEQYWDGSDWVMIGNSRVKWPENGTVFFGAVVGISKYF